jgi:hypothetical protein
MINPEETSKRGFAETDVANIMMQEYATLRQEILFYNGQYKSYVRYFQATATISLALLALFIRNEPSTSYIEPRSALIVVMFAATTIVGFVCFDILESQFSIVVLGSN